jgi:hypothetical protein
MIQLSLGITEPITCPMRMGARNPHWRRIAGGGPLIDGRVFTPSQRGLTWAAFRVLVQKPGGHEGSLGVRLFSA